MESSGTPKHNKCKETPPTRSKEQEHEQLVRVSIFGARRIRIFRGAEVLKIKHMKEMSKTKMSETASQSFDNVVKTNFRHYKIGKSIATLVVLFSLVYNVT